MFGHQQNKVYKEKFLFQSFHSHYCLATWGNFQTFQGLLKHLFSVLPNCVSVPLTTILWFALTLSVTYPKLKALQR